jgi:two-component system chemotaxis response regulator CheY
MTYKILIVDDSEIMRSVLKRIIGMIDLPIDSLDVAINGVDALEQINAQKPDVLLTDLNMPEMSGFELIEKLEEQGVLSEINAMVISTEGNEDRMEDLKSKGVNEYLRKPFTPQTVKESLEKLLGSWS